MDTEAQVRDAIIAELERQADSEGAQLKLMRESEGVLRIDGPVDLEALAMAVVGSVAGGP